MLYFLKASRRNFLKATGLCTLICFVVLLIIGIVISISNNSWSEFLSIQALIILPLFSIGLSSMVMVIAFLSEYNEFRIQQATFAKAPFSGLPSIGFQKIKLFASSFWKLHKEVYVSRLNDYLIIADTDSKKTVSFTLLTTRDPQLRLPAPEHYRDIEVYSKSAGLVVTVPVDSYSTPSIDALHKLLADVSSFLKGHGYMPAYGLAGYESMLKAEMISKGLSGGQG
ncbi:MAG TPA: hypothetical protein VFT90_04460 [Chryseosolibacter sp.]|nr:hypothetical protein [Chryseosolibacter sp.]